MMRPRIVLADDHTLVLEAFKKHVETEFDVVGTASNGRALLQVALSLKPDVIVLDLGMPVLSGFDAAVELKKILPCTKLIVLTMNEESSVAHEAMRLWASGYLLKKSACSELLLAIREVLRGKSYVTPIIAQRLKQEFIRDPWPKRKRKLTPREREVLILLTEGRSMREAATVLNVTPRTIAFHKYRMMSDFGLKTTHDLVMFAINERVVSPP